MLLVMFPCPQLGNTICISLTGNMLTVTVGRGCGGRFVVFAVQLKCRSALRKQQPAAALQPHLPLDPAADRDRTCAKHASVLTRALTLHTLCCRPDVGVQEIVSAPVVGLTACMQVACHKARAHCC